MSFILSQIFGIIALIFVAISYFCKNKNYFLLLQILADICYAISFLFVEVWYAGIVTIASAIRCYVFFVCEKKNYQHSKITLPIFIIINLLVLIPFVSDYTNIIPFITSTIFTIAYAIKNVQLIRIITLFPNIVLLIYNIYCKTYSNALLDLLETIVLIVSIIYFYKIDKKQKIKDF